MSEALQITKTEGGFVTAQVAEIVSDFLRLIHSYILLATVNGLITLKFIKWKRVKKQTN